MSFVGLVILLWGWISKSHDIKKVGLVLVIANAAFAGTAFLTGEPAEDIIEKFPFFSEKLVHDHEEAGEAALIISVIAGFAALATLYLSKKKKQFFSYAFVITSILILTSALSFLWTAHLGGLIRHEEIRSK